MSTKTSRFVVSGVAVAALTAGLVGCSTEGAKNTAAQGTEAASSAASSASSVASEASSTVSSAASEVSSEASSAVAGEATKLTEADIPESIQTAAASYSDKLANSAGEFKSAEKLGDAVLVEYENVSYVETPDSNGPQPIIGKIRETWKENGGLANEIGLPTAPEQAIDNGWSQTFTKDTMFWTTKDGGNSFGDSYQNR